MVAAAGNNSGRLSSLSICFLRPLFLKIVLALALLHANTIITSIKNGADFHSTLTDQDLITRFINATANISGRDVNYVISSRIKHWTGLVVGVLSNSEANHDNRDMIRETWGKGHNILFIVAGEFEKIRGEFEKFDDLLWIDLSETYFGIDTVLPYKSQSLFHAIFSHVDGFDYVLKTDDDSFVNMHELKNMISFESFDYWGHVWKNAKVSRDPKNKAFVPESIYTPDTFPVYCSGAGYLLSKKFLQCLVPLLPRMAFMPREDVSTGLFAKSCGVVPKDSQGSIQITKGSLQNLIIRHEVKHTDDMLQLWKYLLTDSERDIEINATTIVNATSNLQNVKVPTCQVDGNHCVKPYSVPESVGCLKQSSPSIDSSGAWYLPQNFMYKFDQKFANAALDRVISGGSVLELGAGLGCYTYYFRDSGKVLSIDGYEGAANVEEMSEGFIKQADLTKIQDFGGAPSAQQLYDWVVCMEVAEHIPPEHEHTFLINLVSHAKRGVLLTWGILGQGGHGHVNLKSNAYVIGVLKSFGYEYDEDTSLYLRGEAQFNWFKESTMVFRKVGNETSESKQI